MATDPDIATDLAFNNSLTENRRTPEDLRKHQNFVSHSSRRPKLNRRSKYVVMNQNRVPSRVKNGYIPLQPVSVLSSSSSSRLGSISSHRPRRHWTKKPSSSLSERTFRSKPSTRFNENHPISNSVASSSEQKSRGLRKNISERIVQTTEAWLPSLKTTNLSQFERPFLRPLNAIEQILNDEVVEPTATRLANFRNFVNSKFESSFPAKAPETYQLNRIEEVPEFDENPTNQIQRHVGPGQGSSRDQKQVTEKQKAPLSGEDSGKRETSIEDVSSPFGALTQIGELAASFVRRFNIGKLAFHGNVNGGVSLEDDYIEEVCQARALALRREPQKFIMMSPCSSFMFGPPIKPYSPAKSGPQMIMTPLSSMSCTNLLLSPGKEVYSTDTIDITDVQNEQMRRVLRVRFTLNDTLRYGSDGAYSSGFPKRRRSKAPGMSNKRVSPSSPCVLAYDQLNSYMLPLESCQTLQSTKPATAVCYEVPKTCETFSEFGYQVL